MKTPLFLQEFEVLLKQLHAPKGSSAKKRSLIRRMNENPIFHLTEKQLCGVSQTDELLLKGLFQKIHAFM